MFLGDEKGFMFKKSFLKFFISGFVFLIFGLTAFAEGENVLSEIVVDNVNGSYELNLFFDREYKGKAFIQKVNDSSYTVFLPETVMNEEDINIMYSKKQDTDNVIFNIEQKEMIKDNLNSFYTKISVITLNNAPISLVSKVVEKETKTFGFASYSILAGVFFAVVLMLIFFIRMFKNTKVESHTYYPQKRFISDERKPEIQKTSDIQVPEKETSTENNTVRPVVQKVEIEKMPKPVKNTTNPTIQKATLPKVNIKKSLRPAEKSDFGCFDIKTPSNDENNNIEFKSTLKQTSKLLNKRNNVKLKHSNPISENASGLLIPAVEDVIQKTNRVDHSESAPELISVLNITPTKGFYLTTVNEKLALFGFIKDNVFLLSTFQDLSQINLQARFYDKNGNNDIYIVKLDTYKAMVEISDTAMKELAKL